jgi:GNAT superfamily N-acetyltransferase
MTASQSAGSLPGSRSVENLSSSGKGAAPMPVTLLCEAPDHGLLGQVRVSPSGPNAIHISNLMVRRSFRGRNLGGCLLAESLRLGAQWDRHHAWLEADDRGSGRLLRWYQKLGFRLTGEGPHGRPRFEVHTGHLSPRLRALLAAQATSPLRFAVRTVPIPAQLT